jgi:hypothetical protein
MAFYQHIRTFLDAKITTFNGTTSSDIAETTASLDLDKLPANQMHRYYTIRIKDYQLVDDESGKLFEVNVSINFTFGLYKKDSDEYENVIDDYIQPIVKLIKGGYKTTNFAVLDVLNMNVTGLEDVVKGNYLQPSINFQLRIVDAT